MSVRVGLEKTIGPIELGYKPRLEEPVQSPQVRQDLRSAARAAAVLPVAVPAAR